MAVDPLDAKVTEVIRGILGDPNVQRNGFVLRCARECYVLGRSEGLNAGIILADAIADAAPRGGESRDVAQRIGDAIVELHPDHQKMMLLREMLRDGK